jgi:predicted methyltransferase
MTGIPRGLRYSSHHSLADAVASTRPTSDEGLEQFHMQSISLAQQAATLGRLFDGRSLLFLGDDDHVSIVTAAFSDIEVVVVELDSRIVANLTQWAKVLHLRSFRIIQADLRDQIDLGRQCDAFYANPPFSSKNEGHGLRYWISRAVDFCVPQCEGIVAMPSNDDLDWVNKNWLSVQDYVTRNGFRVLSTGESALNAYIDTHDLGLRSQNLHLIRVDSSIRQLELARPEDALYR